MQPKNFPGRLPSSIESSLLSARLPKRVVAAHGLALAIGALCFLFILGPQFLIAHVPFIATPIGDLAAEQASYVLVAFEPWHLPLFALPNVNMPEGANAIFMGGVPLLGLVARVFGEVTGWTPNFLGVWYFVCFVLQAHSFFFLGRQITRERPLLLACCSVAAVLSYAFLTRFGHVSLFGQFLDIYAMGLVLATRRPEIPPWSILAGISLLNAAALGIFAYLAVSIAPMFVAAVLGLVWYKRITLRSGFVAVALFLVIMALLAGGAGYFWSLGRAEPVDMSSYGDLGLNLGSLFLPPRSLLFPDHALFQPWWEGDFYLGLGALGLWLLLGIAAPRPVIGGIRRNWPILAVFSVFAIYCVSNRIAFGEHVLAEYALPRFMAPVVGMARAGGRLFWPIGYLIMALPFALTIRYLRALAPVAVTVALIVTFMEASATTGYMEDKAFNAAVVPLEWKGLQTVMNAHRRTLLFPSFWCDPGPDDSMKRRAHAQIQITSARAHQASNSAITTRKMKDCDKEAAEMPRQILGEGDLDIFTSRPTAIAAFADRPADFAQHCRQAPLAPGTGIFCSAAWQPDTEPPIAQLQPVNALVPSLAPDQPVSFSTKGDAGQFMGAGWWKTAEDNFTWTDGPETSVRFDLPRSGAQSGKRYALEFYLYPFLGGDITRRMVEVSINGKVEATWQFVTGDWSKQYVALPADAAGTIVVKFRESDFRSPKELGISSDPRHLALAVQTMELKALQLKDISP